MDSCDKAVLPRCEEGHWLYKQWSEEQMKKAVDTVIISKMSLLHAAIQYNIPKSTLGDQVNFRRPSQWKSSTWICEWANEVSDTSGRE